MKPDIQFDAAKHQYTVNGEVLPSVTQVLSVLNKGGGMNWWAMKVGVEGVAWLRSQGAEIPWNDTEGIVKLLTWHKRTVNHVRDSAATRGTSIHEALEGWATKDKVPNVADFPEADRGYVRALARALLVLSPKVIASEVMVASTAHGFAGTFDLRAIVGPDAEEVLLDLKTSKRIYESAMLQLEAYEGASVEMGERPTDARMVLRLGVDGDFELARSNATFDDFLAVKAAWDAMQRVKAGKKVAA